MTFCTLETWVNPWDLETRWILWILASMPCSPGWSCKSTALLDATLLRMDLRALLVPLLIQGRPTAPNLFIVPLSHPKSLVPPTPPSSSARNHPQIPSSGAPCGCQAGGRPGPEAGGGRKPLLPGSDLWGAPSGHCPESCGAGDPARCQVPSLGEALLALGSGVLAFGPWAL